MAPMQDDELSADGGKSGEDDRERFQALADQANERHDALTAAIDRLERAIASPAIHREKRWSERIAEELALARRMIAAHVDDIEATDGLFDEITLMGRLGRRIEQLRDEHQSLIARASSLAERLPIEDHADYQPLRREIAQLLGDLRAHRAAEADLIYEAFWIEIGAVD